MSRNSAAIEDLQREIDQLRASVDVLTKRLEQVERNQEYQSVSNGHDSYACGPGGGVG